MLIRGCRKPLVKKLQNSKVSANVVNCYHIAESTATQGVKEKLATGLELNGSSTLAAAIQEANEEIAANQE